MRAYRFNPSVLLLSTVLLAGCMDQNPFPKGTSTTPTPPAPPAYVNTTTPVLAISADENHLFQEGALGTFKVEPRVDRGNPVLTVKNLPPGATFDYATNTFSWEPPIDSGFDPGSPTPDIKTYDIEFHLRSSAYPTAGFTKHIFVTVQNTAQDLDIDNGGIAVMEATEGKSSQFIFKILSTHSPKGPFSFDLTSKIDGAVVVPTTNPAEFELDFTPPYNFVTNRDDNDQKGNYQKNLNLRVSTTNRNGQIKFKTFKMVVHDNRQAPAVSVSNNLVFSDSAYIPVSMEDLNGETTPSLSVDPPPFGNITIQEEDATAARGNVGLSTNPVRVSVITWNQIPTSEYYKPQQLTIHVCGNSYPDIPANSGTAASSAPAKEPPCNTQVINMKFVAKDVHAPLIDRSSWGTGDVKNIRLGSSLQVPLKITDPDAPEQAPTVTISNPDMQFADGVLTVTPTKVGTQVFEVVAQSAYGVQSKISLTVRVYPAEWGKSLILEDATSKNLELQATKSLLDGPQPMDPAVENIGADSMVLRDLVFFTTSLFQAIDGNNPLMSPTAIGKSIAADASLVGRVIVSTPLIGSIPSPRLPKGLSVGENFLDLPDPRPSLNTLSVVPSPGSGFAAPHGLAQLGGTLTKDVSKNPWVFPDQKDSGACKTVMKLQSTDPSVHFEVPAAVECTQADGSKILLLGFELGDLTFDDPADSGLLKSWIQNWVSPQSPASVQQ